MLKLGQHQAPMEALETAIVNRLSGNPSLPSGVAVLPWPDNPLKPSVPSGNTALILVQFAGLRLGQVITPNRGRIAQEGRIEVGIRFFTKALRTGNSAYALMPIAQQSLTQYLPTSSELDAGYSASLPGFQMIEGQLVGNDKSLWDWEQLYALPVIYTQRSTN